MRLFRRRSNPGFSIFLLLFGLCGLVTACGLLVFGVPASIMRAREVANLPVVQPAELGSFGAGEAGLFTAQIPADAPAEEQGLALYYIETRIQGTIEPDENGERDVSQRNWSRSVPPADEIEMEMSNGRVVTLAIPPSTSFGNAETIEGAESADSTQRQERYVGYRPGQNLTIEGNWEGNDRITVRSFYRGTPAAYRESVADAPGMFAIFGVVCACVSVLLLGAGGALRLIGR